MRLFPAAASFDTLSERHGGRYKWFVLLVVAMGIVAGVLSTSSFNVAVPALTRHFGLGHDSVQWAVTGFMAAMTVGMLPSPWLLDRFGPCEQAFTFKARFPAPGLGGMPIDHQPDPWCLGRA